MDTSAVNLTTPTSHVTHPIHHLSALCRCLSFRLPLPLHRRRRRHRCIYQLLLTVMNLHRISEETMTPSIIDYKPLVPSATSRRRRIRAVLRSHRATTSQLPSKRACTRERERVQPSKQCDSRRDIGAYTLHNRINSLRVIFDAIIVVLYKWIAVSIIQ
jgi:hypothetical protein